MLATRIPQIRDSEETAVLKEDPDFIL